MKHYFNTTNLVNTELREAVKNATKQEDEILIIFKHNKILTASQAWLIYSKFHPNCPLTSIRRAITNLMNNGDLVKTTTNKIGIFNKPEYYYKLIN